MTQSEPSAPASAGASGRHIEPDSQPASTCTPQPPSKTGGEDLGARKRHPGVTKANQSTESDWTGRGTAHHAEPRGTPERHAARHNQATRTVGRQQRPSGAANPDSAHNTQQTTAEEQVPGNTHPRHHGPQPEKARYRRRAHTNTNIGKPQPGMADRSQNPGQSTPTITTHPSQG